MTSTVKRIPEGRESAVPYLSISNAAQALEFYTSAFGAVVAERHDMPDGRIGHAEIRIGTAAVMLADEFPEMDFRSPTSLGGSPVGIHIYVEDVDALVARAEAAGAVVKRPPADQFYGDRASSLVDPYGHSWFFATHVEDVTPEEMARRAAAAAECAPDA